MDLVRKYAVGADTIVNIFVLVHHPDSVRSITYRAGIQGIALGTSLKIAGLLELDKPLTLSANNLNHEVGHVLGLSHAWTEDGCPDTQNHPNNCWTWSKDPPCRDNASNNVMDYNGYQNAMTPCQIGRVQSAFANPANRIRKCLSPDWCQYHPEKTVTIRDSVVWDGARDLEGDLIIAPSGRLRINCRVAMPPGSSIVVEPGATLELNGARLHNDCGKIWKGIQIRKKGKLKGRLITLSPSEIENTE